LLEAKLTRYLLKLLPEDDKSQFLARAGYTQETWLNGVVLHVVTIWMTEFPLQRAKFITLYPNKES
jgi:hypothetical protein